MRISDWSSDVCSSDLVGLLKMPLHHLRLRVMSKEYAPVTDFNLNRVRSLSFILRHPNRNEVPRFVACGARLERMEHSPDAETPPGHDRARAARIGAGIAGGEGSSEARRVGDEWVRRCRCGWAPE